MSTATISSPETRPCKLLELPAELRNRIYRFAVLEEEDIEIDSSNLAQPALLRKCHQIRNEASSIYYLENGIGVEVNNFDHKLLEAVCAQAGKLWDEGHLSIMPMLLDGSTSWSNPRAWLEAFHAYKVPDLECYDDCSAFDNGEACNAASGAFKILLPLRDRLTWQEILPVLEIYKTSVEKEARGTWKWS